MFLKSSVSEDKLILLQENPLRHLVYDKQPIFSSFWPQTQTKRDDGKYLMH